jgi:hypothetical protein
MILLASKALHRLHSSVNSANLYYYKNLLKSWQKHIYTPLT